VFGGRAPPVPSGELTALPRPLAGYEGWSRDRQLAEGKKTGGERSGQGEGVIGEGEEEREGRVGGQGREERRGGKFRPHGHFLKLEPMLSVHVSNNISQ